MPTDFIDEEIGSAVVKKSFQTRVNPNRAKEGAIGGCVIQSGIIKKDHYFRIYRKHECIYEGILRPKQFSLILTRTYSVDRGTCNLNCFEYENLHTHKSFKLSGYRFENP